MPATALDSINAARSLALVAMKNDVAITALVPAARHYPPKVPASPTWPYIRHGVGIYTPLKAACLNGANVVSTINAFATGGDEKAGAIGSAIINLFDGPNGNGLSLTTPDGRHAVITVEGANILQDSAEADNWRVIVNTRTTISGG